MLRQLSLVSMLALLTAPQAIACSCSEEPQVAVASPVAVAGNEAAAAAPAPAQPVTAGAVTGKISFEGTPPTREKVDLSPEKVCKDHHGEAGMLNPIGVLVDGSGGLANVFVQITGVPETANKDGKDMKPVTLDQKDCDYKPHV